MTSDHSATTRPVLDNTVTVHRTDLIVAELAAELRARRWTPQTWPSTQQLRRQYGCSLTYIQEIQRELAAQGLLWKIGSRWLPVTPRAELVETTLIAKDLIHRLPEWRWVGLDTAIHTRPIPTLNTLAAQYPAAPFLAVRHAVQRLARRGYLRLTDQVIELVSLPAAVVMPTQRHRGSQRVTAVAQVYR